MNTEIIISLIGVLSTTLSGILTYFFTKKKYVAEVNEQNLKNMQKSLDFYIKLVDDTGEKLEEYRKENEELRHHVGELQTQVLKLMNNICYAEACQHRITEKQDEPKEPKVWR